MARDNSLNWAVDLREYSAELYEDRAALKAVLMQRDCLSNAEAEVALGEKGYPRPLGWRAAIFIPDSYRPRTSVLLIVAATLVWLLLHVTHARY